MCRGWGKIIRSSNKYVCVHKAARIFSHFFFLLFLPAGLLYFHVQSHNGGVLECCSGLAMVSSPSAESVGQPAPFLAWNFLSHYIVRKSSLIVELKTKHFKNLDEFAGHNKL